MTNKAVSISNDYGFRRGTSCLNILLIEDSAADATLVETILREVQPGCELFVVVDGVKALDFLHRRDRYASAPIPHLIVLDWQLPRVNGDTTLGEIKADPGLRRIPVVILSAVEADDQVIRGYELHASCWVVKGTNFEESKRRLRSLIDFWSHTAQLPRTDSNRSLPAA